MDWNIAWFAIYTTVESLVLIIISSIQEMIGLFLYCELDVKQSVGFVFYFLREAVVYIPVIEGRTVHGRTTSSSNLVMKMFASTGDREFPILHLSICLCRRLLKVNTVFLVTLQSSRLTFRFRQLCGWLSHPEGPLWKETWHQLSSIVLSENVAKPTLRKQKETSQCEKQKTRTSLITPSQPVT